jgi:phosphopentomutase
VPILLAGAQVKAGTNLGVRSTFADLGATISDLFGLEAPSLGSSFRAEALHS